MIGASALQHAALDLEKNIFDEALDVDSLFECFKEELAVGLDPVDGLLDQESIGPVRGD